MGTTKLVIKAPRRVRSGLVRLSEQDVYRARTSGELHVKGKQPTLIDLYCGAGGLTLGFTEAFGHRFRPVWANDISATMAATYAENFGGHCVAGDLTEIVLLAPHIIPKADVVIGGPPCQGFSLLNRNRVDDPRKQLWRPFLKVVSLSGASIFVMENVPQLIRSPEFNQIKREAEKLGFQVHEEVLCAADYGVPQKRFRAFIIGCNFADPKAVFPPKKTHFNPTAKTGFQLDFDAYADQPERWRTVRDAIADLRSPIGTAIRNVKPPYDLHFGRTPTSKSLARYRAIPEEGMNRFDLQRRAPELTPYCWIRKTSGGTDLFGRLWWNRPAFTVRTEFFKPEKGRYLHPEQHRPITHREAARLQTFPDDFRFCGSKIEIAVQIGNAVPPMLAARVADSVYALWLAKPNSRGRHIHKV